MGGDIMARDRMVGIYFSELEYQNLREAAYDANLSLSAYCRKAVTRKVDRHLDKKNQPWQKELKGVK